LLQKGKVSLQIQKEMVDEGKPLAQTKAGEQVNGDLEKMAKKHAEEIQKMQKELQDALKAQDQKMQTTLKKELTRSEKKLQQMKAQQEALKEDRRNEIRILEQEFDRRLRRVESEKKEEADATLKAKLAAARQRNKLRKEQDDPQKKNWVKYLKIGGAVTTTVLSIASCVVNPLGVGHAVSSFVHLANLLFAGSGSSSISGEGFLDETDSQYSDDENGDIDFDGGDYDC